LQICLIRTPCADRRVEGVLCRKCCGCDDLEPVLFYNILQLKERVLVVAAAVCSDKGGWSTVSGDTFQIFREESRNASVVYGDAEEGKIIFGKFKDGFLFFINGKIMGGGFEINAARRFHDDFPCCACGAEIYKF